MKCSDATVRARVQAGGEQRSMLTIIFLVIFGGIVVGFGIWVALFGGMKRRGKSGEAELKKRPAEEGRASGPD